MNSKRTGTISWPPYLEPLMTLRILQFLQALYSLFEQGWKLKVNSNTCTSLQNKFWNRRKVSKLFFEDRDEKWRIFSALSNLWNRENCYPRCFCIYCCKMLIYSLELSKKSGTKAFFWKNSFFDTYLIITLNLTPILAWYFGTFTWRNGHFTYRQRFCKNRRWDFKAWFPVHFIVLHFIWFSLRDLEFWSSSHAHESHSEEK
jgi:hypothetical protein